MKDYNYKCIVSKNGTKTYYKRNKSKNGKMSWKKVSNAVGKNAEKGKRKYRQSYTFNLTNDGWETLNSVINALNTPYNTNPQNPDTYFYPNNFLEINNFSEPRYYKNMIYSLISTSLYNPNNIITPERSKLILEILLNFQQLNLVNLTKIYNAIVFLIYNYCRNNNWFILQMLFSTYTIKNNKYLVLYNIINDLYTDSNSATQFNNINTNNYPKLGEWLGNQIYENVKNFVTCLDNNNNNISIPDKVFNKLIDLVIKSDGYADYQTIIKKICLIESIKILLTNNNKINEWKNVIGNDGKLQNFIKNIFYHNLNTKFTEGDVLQYFSDVVNKNQTHSTFMKINKEFLSNPNEM